jgi:hypothetical protein
MSIEEDAGEVKRGFERDVWLASVGSELGRSLMKKRSRRKRDGEDAPRRQIYRSAGMEEAKGIFKPASPEEIAKREISNDPGNPEFYRLRGMRYYSVKADGADPAGCDFCDNWTYMQTCEPDIEEDGEIKESGECYYACPDCIKKHNLPYDGSLDAAEEPVAEANIFKPAPAKEIKRRIEVAGGPANMKSWFEVFKVTGPRGETQTVSQHATRGEAEASRRENMEREPGQEFWVDKWVASPSGPVPVEFPGPIGESKVNEQDGEEQIFQPASREETEKRMEAKRAEQRRESEAMLADAADWVKVAKKELEELLEVETLLIEEDGEKFELEAVDGAEGNNGESAWVVYDDPNDAETDAVRRLRDDITDDPATYGGDWLLNHIDEDAAENFFRDMYDEMNQGYVNDIENEDSSDYTNRLAEEMLERGLISEEDAKDPDYDLEDHKDEMVEQMTDGQIEEGRGGYDYYESNFGEKEAMNLVIDHGLIDVDAAAQYAVDSDGVAHTLDTYDGSEVDLPSGAVAYGTN